MVGLSKSYADSHHCDDASKYLSTNTLGVVTIDSNGVITATNPGSTVKDHFFTPTLTGNNLNSALPTRKEQIAFSQWDTDIYTEEEIEILEQGLSLNATSRCNSNFASGLDDDFINSESPSVTTPYTVTATENAIDGMDEPVRSLETGSLITKNCTSRYGIQDHVGNVSEMSLDTMTFNANTYSLGNFDLPCNDSDDDGTCDLMGNDFSWSIDQTPYNATYFNFALGLPSSETPTLDFELFEIGNSGGILTEQLHDDVISLTSEFYNPTPAGCGGNTFRWKLQNWKRRGCLVIRAL